MRIITGLAAALLWATPAMATDWFWVETAKDGSTIAFVDRDSIADKGMKVRRASVIYVVSEPEHDGVIAYHSTLEYDCADPRYRFIDVRTLGVDGHVIESAPGTGIWREVGEGTIDEAAREFVCSGGDQPTGTRSYGAELPLDTGRAILAGNDPARP